MRVALRVLGCAWLCAWPVLAEPVVTWQAGVGCPGAEEGRAQVERLLHAPLRAVASDLSASVALERAAHAGFAATIEVRQDGPTRTRTLRSADCAVVAHAAAVIVALAIDPSARLDLAAPGDAAQPSPAAAPSPAALEHVTSELPSAAPPTAAAAAGDGAVARQPLTNGGAERASSLPPKAAVSAIPREVDAGQSPAALSSASPARGLQPFVGLGSALTVGILPGLAPALALAAGLETSWLRSGLRASYAPAQRAALIEPAAVSGSVGLSSVVVEAGPHARVGGIDFAWLAGLEVGRFDARGGEGLSSRQAVHPLWLGAQLGLVAALAVSAALRVGVRLEGVVALRRPTFTLQDDVGAAYAVHSPARVSGRGWLELELRFGH